MSDSSLFTCTSLSPREFACMTGAKYFKSNNSILIQTFLSRTAVYQGGALYQSVQQIKKDTNGIFMTIFLWWLKHKTNFDTDIWLQLSILFAQDMLGYFAPIQYWYNETKKKRVIAESGSLVLCPSSSNLFTREYHHQGLEGNPLSLALQGVSIATGQDF